MKKMRFLIGFPIGVTMLLVSYMFVYLVDGQGEYLKELTRLSDVGVLLNQVISAGLLYTMYGVWIEALNSITISRSEKGITYKEMVIFLASFLVVGLVVFIIDKYADFAGEEVVDALLGIGIIFVSITVLAYIITNTINQYVINKKLKIRNQTK